MSPRLDYRSLFLSSPNLLSGGSLLEKGVAGSSLMIRCMLCSDLHQFPMASCGMVCFSHQRADSGTVVQARVFLVFCTSVSCLRSFQVSHYKLLHIGSKNIIMASSGSNNRLVNCFT